MQLRIAAGKPAGIAIVGRRFVGKGREGHDLRTGAAPAAQHMRIDEGEGRVGRERDALARRRQSGDRPLADSERGGEALNAGEVAMALGELGEAMQAKLEVVVLERLHQAEVALGEMDCLVARDGADHRNVERADGALDRGAVAVAADTIQNDAGDADARIEAGKAEHRCGGGLGLAGDVEHEKDRQAKVDGKLRGCALADRAGAGAVEQAHRRLDDQEIGSVRCLIGDAVEQRRAHGPAVEIEARRARGGFVEGRVDIVGAAFGGADAQSAAAERGKQSERDRGLAGTRARGGDEERFCLRSHHTTISGTRAARSRSFALTFTMAPMAMMAGASK